MTRARIIPAIFAAGAFAVLAAGSASADPKKTFKATDLNKDGRIDREEFHRRMTDVHFMMDKNKDGVLVIEEIKGISPSDFAKADRNRDGKLSAMEHMNSRILDFNAADKNGDNQLSKKEIQTWEGGL